MGDPFPFRFPDVGVFNRPIVPGTRASDGNRLGRTPQTDLTFGYGRPNGECQMRKAVIAVVAIIAGFLLMQPIRIFVPSLVPGIRDVTLGVILLMAVLISIQCIRDILEKTVLQGSAYGMELCWYYLCCCGCRC
jgi:hypothetical protein